MITIEAKKEEEIYGDLSEHKIRPDFISGTLKQ